MPAEKRRIAPKAVAVETFKNVNQLQKQFDQMSKMSENWCKAVRKQNDADDAGTPLERYEIMKPAFKRNPSTEQRITKKKKKITINDKLIAHLLDPAKKYLTKLKDENCRAQVAKNAVNRGGKSASF